MANDTAERFENLEVRYAFLEKHVAAQDRVMLEMAERLDRLEGRLRQLHERVVRPMGWKFSPDEALVQFALEQELILEARHGMPYCPCQPIRGERARDMRIVCPCIPFHRKHYDAMKRCWCGLFVHEDVTDPDSLPQFPPDEA